MLFLLRNMDTFNKHRSREIYIIGEIVSNVVLMTINSEGHFESVLSYDMNKQWRLIGDIDVVVGTGDSKKNVRSNGLEKQQLQG
jgi:hypothetical protein